MERPWTFTSVLQPAPHHNPADTGWDESDQPDEMITWNSPPGLHTSTLALIVALSMGLAVHPQVSRVLRSHPVIQLHPLFFSFWPFYVLTYTHWKASESSAHSQCVQIIIFLIAILIICPLPWDKRTSPLSGWVETRLPPSPPTSPKIHRES